MGKKFLASLITFLLILTFTSGTATAETLEQRVSELEPFIGGFPPNLESKSDLKRIEAKYNRIKTDIDKAIQKNPQDLDLLFLRGHLQTMGHNFDKKGAWKGAESDLLKILKINPNHERALLEIGTLYVNTHPRYAPQAREFFTRAQSTHGPQLLEPAQRGLFFALYYQGKMQEALNQADLLRKNFPEGNYQELYGLTKEVIERGKGKSGK